MDAKTQGFFGGVSRLFQRERDVRLAARKKSASKEEIENWLVGKVADQLGTGPEEIDVREPFANFGLDSRTAVSLSGDLENWLERPLSPTLIWDHPTIEALALYLTGENTESPQPLSPVIDANSAD